jgi:hypothetical protein
MVHNNFSFGVNSMKMLKLGLVAILMAGAGTVIAEDIKKKSDEKCAGACATESTCCMTTALAKLPKIEYQVGDEKLCCEESAKGMAKETGSKLVYLVGDDKYESSGKAFEGLVEHTEKFVSDFATPHSCSVSGTTTVAGQSMTCSVKAGEVAAKAKKAMDKVAISYKVGDKTCQCPVEAKTLAASSKSKTLFVVDEEETECEMTARLNLARAKYKAALLAVNVDTSNKEGQ